jgi:hypothetical protein
MNTLTLNDINNLIDEKLGIISDDDKRIIRVLALSGSINKLPDAIVFHFPYYTEIQLYGILWIILRNKLLYENVFECMFKLLAHKLHLQFINQ